MRTTTLIISCLSTLTLAILLPGACGGHADDAFEDEGGAAGQGGAGEGGGSTAKTPVTIDHCPGTLDETTVAALKAGGPVAEGMRWLYPQDETVFPLGILAPVPQWAPQPGLAEGVYLHLRSNYFEYHGCFAGADPARITIPQDVWEQAGTQSDGPGDPLEVEVTTMAGGEVSGPIQQTWKLALGTLKGSIYYNTYDSPQAGNNGAVMRIDNASGDVSPYLTVSGQSPTGPCVGCHALSANGERMVASFHQYPGGPYTSASYDVAAGPLADPPMMASNLDEAGFGALSPDGAVVMTSGTPTSTAGLPFPIGTGNNPGMVGPRTSRLFDTSTGQEVTAPGWDVSHAKMPMFSPDGKHIVFNDHDATGGHGLAVMDVDPTTRTFSNHRVVFEHPTLYPGWPFFTPDGQAIVFALGSADDFASAHPGRPQVASSDLWMVELASGHAVALDRANGTTSTLAYPGRDEQLSFYPTMSPVAAGGYFWLFFTSRRNYGNILVGPKENVASKKIWVAAVEVGSEGELGPAPLEDRSHPAFYLPGQELESGNVRAFAALNPCESNGSSCETGVDCCSGFCVDGICGPPQECAQIDEACAEDADCCAPEARCIGTYCGILPPK